MFLELVDSKITLPYMLYLMNIAHKYKLVFSRVILLYILLRECKGILGNLYSYRVYYTLNWGFFKNI